MACCQSYRPDPPLPAPSGWLSLYRPSPDTQTRLVAYSLTPRSWSSPGPPGLQTPRELTFLPAITVSGLDCNILVECISAGGAPLRQETLTSIEIVCFPKTHIVRDPSGSGFMQNEYDVYSEEPLSIGDQIRYPDPFQGKNIDIYVKNNSVAVDLEYDNTQPFRVYHCA